MATADTIIVDFDSLNSAIKALNTTSGEVGNLAVTLQAGASAIQSVFKADAADTYVEKLNILKSNFDRAKERLDEEGLELKRLYDLEYEAEQTAQSIAEGIAEFTMS